MSTAQKALKIGWAPGTELSVNGVLLRVNRRCVVTADARFSPMIKRQKLRDELRGRGADGDDERKREARERPKNPRWPTRG